MSGIVFLLLAAIVPGVTAKLALLSLSGVIPGASLWVCRQKYFLDGDQSRAGAGWASAGRLMATAWLASLTLALVLMLAVGSPTAPARVMRAVNEGLIEAAERASASMLVVPSIVTTAALFFLSATVREQGAGRTAGQEFVNRLDYLRGVLVVACAGLFCTLVSQVVPHSVPSVKATFGMLAVFSSLLLGAALPFLAHTEIKRLKDDLERPSEPDPEEIPGRQPTT